MAVWSVYIVNIYCFYYVESLLEKHFLLPNYKNVFFFLPVHIRVSFFSFWLFGLYSSLVTYWPRSSSSHMTVCRRQSSHCGQRRFSSSPHAHSNLGLSWAPGLGPLVSLCTNAFPLLSSVHYCLVFWFPHASLGWEWGVCYVQVCAHVGTRGWHQVSFFTSFWDRMSRGS